MEFSNQTKWCEDCAKVINAGTLYYRVGDRVMCLGCGHK